MADEATLLALKEKILARLSDALGSTPLPSYTIDGRSFDWNGYIRELRQMLIAIDEQLKNLPCEEVTIYLDPSIDP